MSGKQGDLRSEESGISGAAGKIMDMLGSLLSGLRDVAAPAIDRLSGVASGVWGSLKERATGAWTNLQGLADGAWSGLKERAAGAWTSLQNVATSAWTGLKERATGAWTNLQSLATGAWNGLQSNVTAAWTNLQHLAGSAWSGLQSGWERLKGMASSAWQGVQGAWEGLKQRVGSTWDSLKDSLSSGWEQLKGMAASAWQGFQNTWRSFKASVAQRATTLVKDIQNAWESIKGFSISSLIDTIAKVAPFVKAIQEAMQNPSSVIDPFVETIASQLDGLPEEAENQGEKLLAQHAPPQSAPEEPGLTVMRQVQPGVETDEPPSDIEMNVPITDDARRCVSWNEAHDGIMDALGEKISKINIVDIIRNAIKDWFWPVDGITLDLKNMSDDLAKKFNQITVIFNFQDTPKTLNQLLDIGLIIWKYVNSILGRLYGWFFMFCVLMGGAAGGGAGGIVGTVGGAIAGLGAGAVPGAAAGGVTGFAAGAGAGAAFAGTVGIYLAGSFVAEALVSISKSFYDLFNVPQTDDERIEDYSQIADSSIGLATMALLALFIFIASKIASSIWNAVKVKLPKPFRKRLEDFGRDFSRGANFAQTESGVTPQLATHDPGIYNGLARMAGYKPEILGKSIPDALPGGFKVTVNGRTIHVIPLPKQ